MCLKADASQVELSHVPFDRLRAFFPEFNGSFRC
jgi:hypothetical protein